MAVPRRNVAYNKPAEPSFLRAFKEKVGYKEPETIESKFDPPKIDESKLDDREDRPDEQPTVVALRPGDLTQEEYDEMKKEDVAESSSREGQHESTQEASRDDTQDKSKKVVFKQPSKRQAGELSAGITASTKKQKKSDDIREMSSAMNAGVKNASLLSFYDDEDSD